MDSARMAETVKVLSSEIRLRIIGLLHGRRLCAGAIARMLDASPSSTSQHLRVLKAADMVRSERCGSHVHYTLNRERLAEIRGELDHLLLAGQRRELHEICESESVECEGEETRKEG